MWNFPLFPDSASTVAPHVDSLYFFLLAVTAFFSLLVAVLIIYFVVKYRPSNKTVSREGAPDSHLMLELIWTGIPTIIVIFVFFWGTHVFYRVRIPPADAMEIHVIGKQSMWKIQHPTGQREINSLHVPINRPIRLTMISEDVIHNFGLPAFRVKQDVLPGTYTSMWFEATKPGRYHIFCDQYCGTLHAQMVGEVVAMEPKDYERWLTDGTTPGLASSASGEELWARMGCNTCHMPGGEGRGPSLVGLYGKKVVLSNKQEVTVDDAYLRESILKPTAKMVAGYELIMPSFMHQLTEENVLELIRYIKAQKGESHAGARTH